MARSPEDFVIDFNKAEDSGRGARVKPGTYKVKIRAAKYTESAEKGTPGMTVTFLILEGRYKGKKLVDTLYATPKAYSRFRTLLQAVGKKVPTKVNIGRIAESIKGEELYIEVDDEVREGYSARSRVLFEGFFSLDDMDDDSDEEPDDDDDDEDEDDDEDDEEDEEPAPPKRKARATRSRKRKPPADDEDDDLDLDEY